MGVRMLLLVTLLALATPQPARAELALAVFSVKGMVCPACPLSIAAALEKLPGVKRADVRLEAKGAKVLYDDARQTPERLAAAIDRLGFQASLLSVTAAPRPPFHVEGLVDRQAVQKVERVLMAIEGVRGVMVDPKHGEVFVEYEGRVVSPRDLIAALEAAGFRARLGSP